MTSRQLGELCKVVLRDVYGELAETVVGCFLDHGRLTASQIAKYTKLPPSTVHRTLVALIQNRFIQYWTDDSPQGSRPQTFYYSVDWNNVYAVLWTGQMMTLVESMFPGMDNAAEVVKNMLVYGHMKAGDYIDAYPDPENRIAIEKTVTSLMQRRVLVPVFDFEFNPEQDIYENLLKESLTKLRTSSQSETAKMTAATQEANQRKETLFSPRSDVKAGLIPAETNQIQKASRGTGILEQKMTVDREAILAVNLEKYLLIARNKYLVKVVERRVGKISARVYDAALQCYENRIHRCKDVQDIDKSYISARDVALRLSADVSLADSFVSPSTKRSANGGGGNPAKKRRGNEGVAINAMDGDDDDDDDDDDEDDYIQDHHANNGSMNGSSGHSLDDVTKHLQLLADSPTEFVVKGPGNKGWYVPYDKVMEKVRQLAYDEYISEKFGKAAARIIRVVRDKGKVDEKLLTKIALLQSDEMRSHTAQLQEAGCLELQEIPKTNDRTPARSLFLWFHRTNRAYSRLLQDLYNTMKNLYLRLLYERSAHSLILSKIEREDVKGNEQEFLSEAEKKELNAFRMKEEKIIVQISRLDELVRVFRDY